ncbi:hypothetical protein, partial [Salmonella enterica]|uniref:hypothetical protein n=1 Tax=Salmonella enterica TaxID=28901 RepID=UPI001112E3AD
VKTPGFIIGGIDSDVTQGGGQVMRDGHSEGGGLTQNNGQGRFLPGSAGTDGDYTLTGKGKKEGGENFPPPPVARTPPTAKSPTT